MEKTVVKALRVLETLAASDRPRSVAELAEELELSKSNVYRLLDTLHEADYVSRVNGRNTFELSLKMWHLGAKVTARLDIKTAALPYLGELRDKTQETARLTVLHGHHGVCIEQVETKHPMRVQTPIGGALLLYCSATGKRCWRISPTRSSRRSPRRCNRLRLRRCERRTHFSRSLRRSEKTASRSTVANG